jgi:DNA (cytosine-5)-methyltransferase 1
LPFIGIYMKYLSVCSGIEAATCAWENLGWQPAGFSEIEPFPCAVLKHHYPTVTNYGDINEHAKWDLPPIDLLVGGTPCQSFSIAGLRKGLEDPRGNIMLTYLRILESRRPKWTIWENVPGVLSSNGGRDFSTFITSLGNMGYGWAYRVLDAQWFGLAQRRKRVFVVGCLGDRTSASKVLFESQSVQRNPAPSRYTGKTTTRDIKECTTVWRAGDNTNSETCINHAGTLNCNKGQRGGIVAMQSTAVRRLTPTECERLQGFPDGYTAIAWRKKLTADCPDGPRYKALGNSMAVPVMKWIGERINNLKD